jgi:hypothetical protein
MKNPNQPRVRQPAAGDDALVDLFDSVPVRIVLLISPAIVDVVYLEQKPGP